jgi:hypothetical protein
MVPELGIPHSPDALVTVMASLSMLTKSLFAKRRVEKLSIQTAFFGQWEGRARPRAKGGNIVMRMAKNSLSRFPWLQDETRHNSRTFNVEAGRLC